MRATLPGKIGQRIGQAAQRIGVPGCSVTVRQFGECKLCGREIAYPDGYSLEARKAAVSRHLDYFHPNAEDGKLSAKCKRCGVNIRANSGKALGAACVAHAQALHPSSQIKLSSPPR